MGATRGSDSGKNIQDGGDRGVEGVVDRQARTRQPDVGYARVADVGTDQGRATFAEGLTQLIHRDRLHRHRRGGGENYDRVTVAARY